MVDDRLCRSRRLLAQTAVVYVAALLASGAWFVWAGGGRPADLLVVLLLWLTAWPVFWVLRRPAPAELAPWQRLADGLGGVLWQYTVDAQQQVQAELLGGRPADLLGQAVPAAHFYEQLLSQMEPESRASFLASLRRAAADRTAWGHQVAVQRADGRTVWVAGQAELVADAGEPRYVGVLLGVGIGAEAEAAWRETEQRLRLISDNLPNGMVYQVVCDAQNRRRFTYVGASVERAHGLTPDQVYADAQALYGQIHPDDLPGLLAAEVQSLRAGETFNAEVRFCLPDGRLRWALLHSAPRRLADGSTIWDGVEVDLTERKQAEAALRETEQRLALISEHLPGGMVYQVVTHPDGRRAFTYVGASVTRLHGVTPEEVYADPSVLYRQIHEDDLPGLVAAENRSAAELSVFNHEVRHRLADGTVRWTLLRSAPRRQPDGSTLWDGIELDLTERRLAEEALREGERNYREIFNATSDSLFIHDEAGRIIDMNDRACEMYGCDRATLSRLTAHDLAAGTPPYTAEDAIAHVQKAFAEGTQTFEWLSRRYQGELFWTEVALRSCVLGGRRRIISAVRDITSRKQTEANLERTRLLLEAVVDQSPVPTVVVSAPDLVIRLGNRAASVVLGVENEGQAIGQELMAVKATQPWTDLLPDGRVYEADQLPLARALRGETVRNEELRIRRQDGTESWVLASGTPVFDGHGGLVAGLVVFTDITERKLAEEALREKDRRLRQFVEQSLMAICIVDTDGRIIEWNRCYERISGLSREAVLGELAWDVTLRMRPPEERSEANRARLRDAILAAMEPGAGTWTESGPKVSRNERPDGTIYYFEHLSFQIDVGGACQIGVVGADVTERQRALEELAAGEERLRLLVQNASDAIVLTDAEGLVLQVHGPVERLTGYRADQLIGQSAFARIHQGDREAARRALEAVVETPGLVGRVAYRQRHAGGSWVRLEAAGTNLLHDPKIRGVVINVRDVTERHRAEEAWRRSELRTRSIIEALPIGMHLYRLESDGRLVLDGANPAADRILGIDHRPLAGLTILDAFPGLQGTEVPEHYAAAARAGTAWATEQIRYHEGRIAGAYDVHAFQTGPGCMAAAFADITERKRAEAERESLIDQLERTNEELERFTYTVSHDLKSPLITIKGFLGRLRLDLAAGRHDRIDRWMDRIDHAGEHMARLLDELLQLSRIGRLVNPPEAVPFGRTVASVVELLAGSITEHGVRVEVAAALPVVYGDQQRLREVLQNLLDNAIRFTANRPEATVMIGCAGGDPATGWPVFFVRDNGAGFNPAYAERIFGLFEQLDPGLGGTGIGLTLVKRTIEVHGGRVWAESQGPGTGACFWFTLPSPP